MLYVVATPIGNLADISPRALEVLSSVAIIACEDTRQTAKLLARYNINTCCISCHAHNEMYTFNSKLLPLLQKGKDVALVSDSGTPLVSDPGAALVEAALQHNIKVSPIPGASSVTAILSVSGLHGKGFWFEGFLQRKSGARSNRLKTLLERNETFIILESPHRVLKLLTEITDIESTREVMLGREITKIYEEFQKNTASELFESLNTQAKTIKGECIVLVFPRKK